MEEIVLPRERHISDYPIPNGHPWKHTHKYIQTNQGIFIYLGICVFTCVYIDIQLMQKETMILTESKGYIEGSRERKGREMKKSYYNLKK